MTPTPIRFKALPKQKDFITAQEREVLYSGAYRAGKSVAVCLKALVRVTAHKGAREALVRKELVTLKATTLRTLLKGDGLTPPVLPEGTYTHYKADKIIAVNGCGEIVYFGLDDDVKIGSYTLSGIGVDEATQLTEDEYGALRGRVSLSLPGLPGQLYGACNPAGPHHHLAVRFGLSPGYAPAPNCRGIQTSMQDNSPNLSADYLGDAMTWTGIRKSRYVDGLWVASDGLIYDGWNPADHERTLEGPWARTIIAVDEGTTHPFAALRARLDPDGRVHVDAERYGPGLTTQDKIANVRALGGDKCLVIYDAAAAGLGTDLRAAGFDAIPCDKSTLSVCDGIRKVQDRLVLDLDGKPRLTVAPACVNLLRELSGYEWDDKATKEKPKNGQLDHACDALRYLVVYLDGTTPLNVSVVYQGAKAPDMTGEAVAVQARKEQDERRRRFVTGADMGRGRRDYKGY